MLTIKEFKGKVISGVLSYYANELADEGGERSTAAGIKDAVDFFAGSSLYQVAMELVELSKMLAKTLTLTNKQKLENMNALNFLRVRITTLSYMFELMKIAHGYDTDHPEIARWYAKILGTDTIEVSAKLDEELPDASQFYT